MSFIVAIYVPEGVVMAADSRLTFTRTESMHDGSRRHLAVGISNNSRKSFLTPSGVGLCTYGAASDNRNNPIGGLVDEFILDHTDEHSDANGVARDLMAYLRANQPDMKTGFLVGGYVFDENEKPEPRIWDLWVAGDHLKQTSVSGNYGLSWRGVSDVVSRLIQPLWMKNGKIGDYKELPYYQIQWATMSLNEAIDFAVYAIESTIELMRFQPRNQTVGGEVDVMVITPRGSRWINRKRLKVKRDFYDHGPRRGR